MALLNFFVCNHVFPQVPQVDIEKLPVHLIEDILSRQDKPDEYKEVHDEEKEDDIYSLEHQENIEEFKLKGIV